MVTSTCVNCAQPVSTSYCSHCGQKHLPKKLSFLTLWVDFQARIYGFDGMFPRTLTDLTARPGQVAREFIRGNRVKHYGPVGYFFLMITVLLLLASLLDVDIYKFSEASKPTFGLKQGAGQKEIQQAIGVWVNDNMRLMAFIIAMGNIFFTWLFFRKSGYNFIESSVLIFFVQGHAIWLRVFSLIVYTFTGFALNSFIIILITTVYTVFAFVDFYIYQTKPQVVAKGFLVVMCSYLTLISIFIAGFIFYLLSHPDVLEKMRPSNNL